MAKYLRSRAVDETGKAAPPRRADAGEIGSMYPALAEWLTLTELDGKPRETATLLVFAEGPLWKCRILDRTEDAQAFLTGRTLVELLDALEAGLVEDTLDWRQVKAWGGKK